LASSFGDSNGTGHAHSPRTEHRTVAKMSAPLHATPRVVPHTLTHTHRTHYHTVHNKERQHSRLLRPSPPYHRRGRVSFLYPTPVPSVRSCCNGATLADCAAYRIPFHSQRPLYITRCSCYSATTVSVQPSLRVLDVVHRAGRVLHRHMCA
jgi:hypothetical protein